MFALGLALTALGVIGVAIVGYRQFTWVDEAEARAAAWKESSEGWKTAADEWKAAYQSLVLQVRNAVKPKETVVAPEFWAPKSRYEDV